MQYAMHVADYYHHLLVPLEWKPSELLDAWYEAWTSSIPNLTTGV